MALNTPVRDWRGKTVWLVGASTGIGRATASALHRLGAQVVVSARNAEALNAFVAAHAGAMALPLDVTDAPAIEAALATIQSRGGGLDHLVYCAGHYNEMDATHLDLSDMLRHLQVNYVGALNVLAAVLPALMRQQRGHVSLVASVAGYRGLPKSLAYGPTKAALINLAETLYLDLRPQGVGVSLINPGFVETPLTAHNDFPMPALMSPEQAAREIIQGWENGAFEIHFPKRFTRVMKLLQWLPYGLFFPAVRRFTRT